MKIEQLDEADNSRIDVNYETQIVKVDAKRVLVGAGARLLFYPTLLYNVLRNKIESEFRWWDRVDEVYLFTIPPFIALYLSLIVLFHTLIKLPSLLMQP